MSETKIVTLNISCKYVEERLYGWREGTLKRVKLARNLRLRANLYKDLILILSDIYRVSSISPIQPTL